jgi:Tol biopolymer transport system component
MRSFVSVLVVAVILGAAADARATFPGRNGRIAFVRGVHAANRRDWLRRDVYSVKPDGSGLRNLTRDRSSDQFSPAWSADGRRITYVEADGTPTFGDELWTMRADGSRKRRLTRNDTGDEQPAWSPDGKWIVFSRQTAEGDVDLAVIASTGGPVRLLMQTTNLDELFPAWSPDGRRIAFIVRPRVEALTSLAGFYVLTIRTGQIYRAALDYGLSVRPSWTPRGRLSIIRSVWAPNGRVRVISNPQGPYEVSERIEIQNLDGSLRRVVTHSVDPVDDYDPAWQSLPRRKAGGASVR